MTHKDQENAYFRKYYRQLEGFKIEAFIGMSEDSFGGDAFPQFVLTKGKQKFLLEVSRDPEGNGGGFLFFNEHDFGGDEK